MRAGNRVIAAVLALSLAVAGILAAIEIVAAAAGADHAIVRWPAWYRDAIARPWNDGAVRAVGVGLALLGALLVLLQLLRRRPRQLRMAPGRTGLVAEVDRRSLERSVRRTSANVDGIDRTSVRIDGSRLVVRARSHRRDITGLDHAVGEHADGRIESLQLERRPTVGVGVEGRDT